MKRREESKKPSHNRKKEDTKHKVFSFSKHSESLSKDINITHEENNAIDTKYVSTCTQNDESF